MEQWEHMVLESVVTLTPPHGDGITAVTPDGQFIDIDSGDPSTGRLVQALNELGQQGWAMVTKETHRTERRRTETFWLKRQAPTSNTGDAFFA
ncbi:MAG: hypothetical protein JWO98_672 [Frankiales bacterium]|nr:hypothetical protein [Frankiales bacterium]